jgi:putative heme iron utilization protein
MEKQNAARSLLLEESFGVLSTISVDLPGYPFGSVTPYCTDRQCLPIVYISYIAQHTKNIVADPRVSLTVVERSENGASDDVQAQGRVTCIANAKEIPSSDTADVRDRYFRYFPSARQYERTHFFAFFRLELVRVRFIGGFGQIFWVEPGEFMTDNPFPPAAEAKIIQHMNKDHAEALSRYVGGGTAEMAGIDAEGFDVLKAGRKIRIPFSSPVSSMEEARQALVEMARRPA